MGSTQDHALGRNRAFFCKTESTYGTFVKPAATDAAKVLNCSFDFKQERRNRMDSRAVRAHYERITGRKEVSWSVDSYLIPSGSSSTDPDLAPLFKAAMGASSSQVFSLTSGQALDSLTLVQHMNSVVMESVTGAYVDTMTISMSGGDDPRVSFSGGASTHIHTSTSTTHGTGSSSDTLIVDDADAFEIGSVVKIGSSHNGGVGFEVTNKVGSTLTLGDTLSWADEVAVIPYTPDETVSGSPSPGITGSVTLAGNSGLEIVSFELSLVNNIKAISDEAFASTVTDFIPGFRDVTGSLSVRCAKDQALEIGKRKGFSTRDLQIVSGSGTGNVCTIDLDQVEFEFSALNVPESEEVIIDLPFRALAQDAASNDELTITFS